MIAFSVGDAVGYSSRRRALSVATPPTNASVNAVMSTASVLAPVAASLLLAVSVTCTDCGALGLLGVIHGGLGVVGVLLGAGDRVTGLGDGVLGGRERLIALGELVLGSLQIGDRLLGVCEPRGGRIRRLLRLRRLGRLVGRLGVRGVAGLACHLA